MWNHPPCWYLLMSFDTSRFRPGDPKCACGTKSFRSFGSFANCFDLVWTNLRVCKAEKPWLYDTYDTYDTCCRIWPKDGGGFPIPREKQASGCSRVMSCVTLTSHIFSLVPLKCWCLVARICSCVFVFTPANLEPKLPWNFMMNSKNSKTSNPVEYGLIQFDALSIASSCEIRKVTD